MSKVSNNSYVDQKYKKIYSNRGFSSGLLETLDIKYINEKSFLESEMHFQDEV